MNNLSSFHRIFTILAAILLLDVTASAQSHYQAISTSGLTWYQARDSAIALGGYLVTITSQIEQNEIADLVDTGIWWIGATDEASEGNWQWVTGEPWGYTNWRPGEPNNLGGDENVATILPLFNDRWNDADTAFTGCSGFILEIPPAPPLPIGLDVTGKIDSTYTYLRRPSVIWHYSNSSPLPQQMYEIEVGTDNDWSVSEMWDSEPVFSSDSSVEYQGPDLEEERAYYIRVRVNDGVKWGDWLQKKLGVFIKENHFYELIVPPKNWAAARDSAIQAGGHLATITNATELPLDTLLYPNSQHYLHYDFTYIGSNASLGWQWITGEPSSYTNWELNEPNNNGAMVLLPNWKWAEQPSSYEYPFWIEYNTPWGIKQVNIEDSAININVTIFHPLIAWNVSLDASLQEQYEIEVGTDMDWTVAEMWDSGPIFSSDTEAVYDGLPLIDEKGYVVRVRASYNSGIWTPWAFGIFFTKYPPTTPIVDTHLVSTFATRPRLTVGNSTNGEMEFIYYRFEVYRDSLLTQLQDSISGILSDSPLFTSWQVANPLQIETKYWWRCRAYVTATNEVSDWSLTGRLFIKKPQHPPTAPGILFTEDSTFYTMLPSVAWVPATDPDAGDSIHYRIELYQTPAFTLVRKVDSLVSTSFTLTDSLEFGNRYALYVYAIDQTSLNNVDMKYFWTWTLGDVNQTHTVTIQDLTDMVQFLFNSGQPISPLFVGDLNQSCTVTIADLVYLVQYLFNSGTAPKVGCGP